MPEPRAVFPGTFIFVTRSITQRLFLLRPDDETNNNFVYCLGEAANRYEVDVLAAEMMSNHSHVVAYDRHGNAPAFYEHFYKMLARCQNEYLGRSENMWSSNPPDVVVPANMDALIAQIVYTFTNSVAAGLVERVHHWPGPPFLNAFLTGRSLKAKRPKFFFSPHGVMPETVELKIGFPASMGDMRDVVEEIRRKISEVEDHHIAMRTLTGRRVYGRANVKRQSPFGYPENPRAKRGDIVPRVAARSKWARIAALQRNRRFALEHAKARVELLNGNVDVIFPAGTYWLRRFVGVEVAGRGPPPLF